MNRTIKPIILALVTLVTTISCEKTNEIVDEQQLDLSPEEKEIVKDSNDFTLNDYGFLSQNLTSNEYLFYSGASISSVLSMTANGAAGTNFREIFKALSFDKSSEDQINSCQHKLLNSMPFISNSSKINIAYGIWHSPDINLHPAFKTTVTERYKSRIAAQDYKKVDET